MSAKYVIIIPDGAADDAIADFGDKTVFEAANIPNIDAISIEGRQGLCQTVPHGMPAGSDVAQMSLLGYDPVEYYTGRAPIEAVAMDITLSPTDWVFRCNLVTTANGLMVDHSAGHISTDEASKLIFELDETLGMQDTVDFHTGVSYRHLCVIHGTDFADVKTQPPHDIIGQKVSKNIPKGKHSDMLNEMMEKSQQLFESHDINTVRQDLGENQVSSIWLWGQGKKAVLDKFSKKYGLKGATITAVDLVRGLSKLIGFDVFEVEGATGYVNTNYKGKAEAAINALEKYDIVFIHVEGPDEAGHAGNAAEKKLALEMIDKYIVGPVHETLKLYDQYRILIMPDHPTPVETQAHTDEPVPFAMAGTGIKGMIQKPLTEANSAESGFRIERGCEMMEYFLKI